MKSYRDYCTACHTTENGMSQNGDFSRPHKPLWKKSERVQCQFNSSVWTLLTFPMKSLRANYMWQWHWSLSLSLSLSLSVTHTHTHTHIPMLTQAHTGYSWAYFSWFIIVMYHCSPLSMTKCGRGQMSGNPRHETKHAEVVKIIDPNKQLIQWCRAAIPDTRAVQSENLSVENWEEIAFPGSAPRIELQSRPLPLSGFFHNLSFALPKRLTPTSAQTVEKY